MTVRFADNLEHLKHAACNYEVGGHAINLSDKDARLLIRIAGEASRVIEGKPSLGLSEYLQQLKEQ